MRSTVEGELDASLPGSTAVPEADVPAGAEIDQYRIRRLIGSGGMGQVYLARDIVLGRLVALKFMHAGSITQADLDAVMSEARAIARLNHPNIVSIYGVGTWHDRPYLALEYVQGETLEARLSAARARPAEALRHLRAVLEAVAVAHGAGVRHLDLKPANILIGVDGRPRVVDFGLARMGASAEPGVLAGTPRYMAPEQWAGGATTDRTDVWALGVILVELLSGAHPFEAPTAIGLHQRVTRGERSDAPLMGVSAALDRLVRRALSRDPAERPAARELASAVEDELEGGHTALPDSPFPGLRTFDEDDAALYFGRSSEIDAFVERMRYHGVLVVTGPSGAGKSSFVTAGVIPRLRSESPTHVVVVRPGPRPFAALAHALYDQAGWIQAAAVSSRLGAGRTELAAALEDSPALLALGLQALSEAQSAAIVLVVDQLEELFTHVAEARVQEAFVAALFSVQEEADPRTRVLMTLRDDHLGRLAHVTSVFVLPGLGPAELRRTIEAPVLRFGYSFEDPRMVEELLVELGHDATPLPIIQFACHELWAARDEARRILTRAALEHMGGATGALARHAERVMSGFSEAEVTVARRVLLRLVTADGNRRVMPTEEVVAGDPDAEKVVGQLVESRLLLQQRHTDGDGATLELTHESLTVRWVRLQSWLMQSRQEVLVVSQLTAAAGLWAQRGRPEAEVWSGEALREALQLDRSSLSETARAFLAIAEQRQLRAARRRRWSIGAVLAAAIAVAIVAAGLASEFRRREQQARAQTEALQQAGLDLGAFELVVETFDWDPQALRAQPERAGHDLRLTILHGDDEQPLLPEQLRITAHTTTVAGARAWRVEAPGVPLLLTLDGRGDDCGPARIRYARPPGYAERKQGRSPIVRLAVPSCRASSRGMLAIPAGQVVLWGEGEPRVVREGFSSAEAVREIADFELDLTETSNAQLATYTRYASLTGDAHPRYPEDSGYFRHASQPEYAVSYIDWAVARRYCRFWGKELPTWAQWSAAARGTDRRPEAQPRRTYPWAGSWDAMRANTMGERDGHVGTAPVTAFAPGAGPYGHVNLVGNVSEWLLGLETIDTAAVLVPIAGGDWSEPATDHTHAAVFPDNREPRFLSYGTGVRCAR